MIHFPGVKLSFSLSPLFSTVTPSSSSDAPPNTLSLRGAPNPPSDMENPLLGGGGAPATEEEVDAVTAEEGETEGRVEAPRRMENPP